MSDDPPQPVVLPYATPPNPWPRLLATAGVGAAVPFILLIVPIGAMGFRVALAVTLLLPSPLMALGLGLMARSRASRHDLDVRRRARRAIVLGAAELAILLAAALPMWELWRSREAANRAVCQKQLRAIGQTILLYSNDNRGQWPPTLDALIPTMAITGDIFVCPSSHDVPAPPGATPEQQAATFRANPKHCSYIYLGRPPPSMRSDPPGDVVVAYEPLLNHHDGINVLFGDGHVEWLNQAEAKHLLAELQAGRNPPQPLTPATAPSPAASAQ